LRIRLPSGRYLTYRNVSIDPVPSKWDTEKLTDAVTYQSTHGYRKSLYGGLLCENIVQASCRDYTVLAITRCERDGIPVVLHVHDEVVVELKDESQFDRFMHNMTLPPDWAPDFPLDAEGGMLDRYHKSTRPGNPEVVYRNGSLKI
jgi:DNA polymerase bacteriophage-type